MKIAKVEHLHADGGRRNFDFLKITTDDGLVGWSEYNESLRRPRRLRADRAAGTDADRQGPARLRGARRADAGAAPRRRPGGVIQQAIGAIENALLDVKAKALGMPVYELLGGPVRDRSASTGRTAGRIAAVGEEMQLPPLRTSTTSSRSARRS